MCQFLVLLNSRRDTADLPDIKNLLATPISDFLVAFRGGVPGFLLPFLGNPHLPPGLLGAGRWSHLLSGHLVEPTVMEAGGSLILCHVHGAALSAS